MLLYECSKKSPFKNHETYLFCHKQQLKSVTELLGVECRPDCLSEGCDNFVNHVKVHAHSNKESQSPRGLWNLLTEKENKS